MKKALAYFLSLSREKQIFIAVFFLHLFFLLFLSVEAFFSPLPSKKVPIQVKTAHFVEKKEPKPVVAKAASPKPAVKTGKQPVALPHRPLVKKTAQEPPKVKKTESKAALHKLSVPEPVIFHAIESKIEKEEVSSDYLKELTFLFQSSLELPETGKVKARLRIEKRGDLSFFEILESESEKNSDFLKNQLPKLKFPCLNSEEKAPLNLTVVFQNANSF